MESLVTPWYVAPPLSAPSFHGFTHRLARYAGILILPVAVSQSGLFSAAFVPMPAAEFAAAPAPVAGTAASTTLADTVIALASATLRTAELNIRAPLVEHSYVAAEANACPLCVSRGRSLRRLGPAAHRPSHIVAVVGLDVPGGTRRGDRSGDHRRRGRRATSARRDRGRRARSGRLPARHSGESRVHVRRAEALLRPDLLPVPRRDRRPPVRRVRPRQRRHQ